jgi:hypothetical protein
VEPKQSFLGFIPADQACGGGDLSEPEDEAFWKEMAQSFSPRPPGQLGSVSPSVPWVEVDTNHDTFIKYNTQESDGLRL